ncbi:CoA transferase [Streptomyces chiangmaiensis]|uniref:CoA transferase n=1 Tax=Streptomyces chiangmaiensis TaxID=766497 RepID=A0ABU7FU85_9ACTN|nr:CoA transferase [Streptomyces chiangmaiensis]MED7827518.1 CoA transferase [Streptomyces chiangmaiensis]
MNLTEQIRHAVKNPISTDVFDFEANLATILREAGLKPQDCGGEVTFASGADPLIPGRFRFGSAAALALAAKGVAASAIWRDRGGHDQDINIDVRKAFRRFAGFADGRWELINGRRPSIKWNKYNPFVEQPFFRRTKDGRSVVALNIYPSLRARALDMLDCADHSTAINAVIAQWNADELEQASADSGIVLAKVRTAEEFLEEPQYTDVLADLPLIDIEKIADSDPVPFSDGAVQPLDGIRALGMGHVIAGAGIGRDLASFGADVLNVWRPDDVEMEPFYWDTQVGMRSTYLGDADPDRTRFDQLLVDADVFFSNRHPGYLVKHGLTAEELSAKRPGLIHAEVTLHGPSGPWMNRPGFDEIGACVSGIFALEGTLEDPKQPPILPVVDNVVGWLGTVGVLAALRRRATEGGSYRVRVSLTKTCLWLISLGVFDKKYTRATAGSTPEHTLIDPDVFTAPTPLGMYQGMTDQIEFSSLRQGWFSNVLSPMGADDPTWRTARR